MIDFITVYLCGKLWKTLFCWKGLNFNCCCFWVRYGLFISGFFGIHPTLQQSKHVLKLEYISRVALKSALEYFVARKVNDLILRSSDVETFPA